MRWTIGSRIFVALALTSVLIIGLNAAATRWSFQTGFVAYIGQQEEERLNEIAGKLLSIYQVEGSWTMLTSDRRLWDELFRDNGAAAGDANRRRPPGRRGAERRPPHELPPPDNFQGLPSRVSLLDTEQRVVMGPKITAESSVFAELSDQDEVIGFLYVRPPTQLTDSVDLNFVDQQTRAILYIGLAILALAAALAMLIARQIVRPIKSLASGARAMADGEFEKRIMVARDDEMGDLARDFNALAETLQANQQMRRQWVSDISHELRTPLAILRGELEAIEDGVRQFDAGARASLQAEVARLTTLVADLHELTLSDEGGLRYEFGDVSLQDVASAVLDACSNRLSSHELSLERDFADEAVWVIADANRLDQLLNNLLENAIRYTDGPGRVRCSIHTSGNQAEIVIEDSAPGVGDSQYEKLFERLYRVDPSRNRGSGGSGLGLSIARSIVAAHSGRISAGPSSLGGVRIEINLPLKASRRDAS